MLPAKQQNRIRSCSWCWEGGCCCTSFTRASRGKRVWRHSAKSWPCNDIRSSDFFLLSRAESSWKQQMSSWCSLGSFIGMDSHWREWSCHIVPYRPWLDLLSRRFNYGELGGQGLGTQVPRQALQALWCQECRIKERERERGRERDE